MGFEAGICGLGRGQITLKWRWAKDSNLRRGQTLNGFQDRRFRPLSQPTGNFFLAALTKEQAELYSYALWTQGATSPLARKSHITLTLGDSLYCIALCLASGIVGGTRHGFAAGLNRGRHIFMEQRVVFGGDLNHTHRA